MGKFTRGYRKIGWIIALLVVLVTVAVVYARDARLDQATIKMINDAQAVWYLEPVLNYHIVVDVNRPDEKRRNDITVQNGVITSATVKYWDSGRLRWEEPYDLNEDQAFPFTIPGLYDMLRGALNNSNRPDIQVDMRGDPPFPHRIVLGPVWQDGVPVWGTETEVIVREFEILP